MRSLPEQIMAIKSVMKPKFTIEMDKIKGSNDWKVGETYTIEMEVTQVAVEMVEDKKIVTFEIEDIKENKKNDVMSSIEKRLMEIENNYETA